MIDIRTAAAAVRQREDHLWLTVFWDEPGVGDVEAVIDAWDRAVRIGAPYRSVVDVRHVRRVGAHAFAALAGDLRRRRDAFAPLLEKQAILRPEGIVGAISAGVLALVEWGASARLFADASQAIAWIAPGEPDLIDDFAQWCEELTGTSPLVARLAELLEAEVPDVDLARAARRLGMSPRSLQRHLRDANTSFAALLERARFERAKKLLESTDAKVASIAAEVGYGSEQRFRERFARLTNTNPAEWRARRR